jgi:superfamily II DNA or RNA helicase
MSSDQQVLSCLDGEPVGPQKGMDFRPWQSECLNKYTASASAPDGTSPHTFCLYAAPGAGKTKAAGYIASWARNDGRVEQVVMICPNRSIRWKTQKDFLHYFGLELVVFNKKKHANGIPRMQHGYILTYGALMQDPTLHRRLCQGARTLVVFDEIHHLGDRPDGGWGRGALEAFGKVAHILALTGTPYRSDGTQIPFVCYEPTEKNGIRRFKADYTYSIGRAVADGICRKPLFTWHDATARMRCEPDGGSYLADFDDSSANAERLANVLRGAVKYGSTDRRAMLKAALAEVRKERRKVILFLGGDTQGDQAPCEDATQLLPLELQELGYGPDQYEVVTSDDKDAQKKIEAFGAHPTKWILISVQMVSEGTDIPEISAAIFLTSITAKQTTVQRIGRALRLMKPDPHPDARIFMFRHPGLFELAREMEDEIRSEIDLRRKKREASPGDGDAGGQHRIRVETIGVGDGAVHSVSFHGQTWPAAVFEKARRFIEGRGLPATAYDTVLRLMVAEGDHERD